MLFAEKLRTLDLNFQSFYLTSSNFMAWRENFQKENGNLEKTLEEQLKPIKKENGGLDILYEILLKEGVLLTTRIEAKNLAGKQVYNIPEYKTYICLEDKIDLDLMEKLLAQNPEKIILLDSSFDGNDELKINCFQKVKILQAQKNRQTIFKVI
jgi:adenine-specific DNA-methyltransferase